MKGSAAPSAAARHPALNLLLLVGLVLGAVCVALFGIMLYAKLRLGTTDVGAISANPAGFRLGWEFMMVSQGLTLLLGFGGAALALATVSGYRWGAYFAPRPAVAGRVLLLVALLVIVLLPLMAALVEWNAKTHFPAFLREFEAWARESETRAEVMTKYLTQFTSPGRFLVGVLVVAVVPAVAEELFFRGVVQRNLVQWFSPHVGIWLAAAIFSAIHFQFFGFFPRFVLGIVFGYLYYWSGNILVPMAAHFTQNGFQLLLLYLQQQGRLGADFNSDSNTSLPWPWAVASALLSAGLLYLIYQQLRPAAPTERHTLSGEGVAVAVAPTETPAAEEPGGDFRPDPTSPAVDRQFS